MCLLDTGLDVLVDWLVGDSEGLSLIVIRIKPTLSQFPQSMLDTKRDWQTNCDNFVVVRQSWLFRRREVAESLESYS